MTIRHIAFEVRAAGRAKQRGVVLFIALISMVVLSLAAVALIRSVDTGTSIAGNLAIKQGTLGPINYAVERAVDALFQGGPGSIADPFFHDTAKNYYANIQPGETANGIPAILYGPLPLAAYDATLQKYDDPSTVSKYTVRWVIERLCQGSAPAPGPYEGSPLSPTGLQACDLMVPKVAKAGSSEERWDAVTFVPLYRVSIRVDGPSKTVTYAQAMLR